MVTKVNIKKFIQEQIANISNSIGTAKAFCAVSGGVDSTTVAVLAAKAIGDQLAVVFIDDGLMREGEGDFVSQVLKPYTTNVSIVNAEKEFFESLAGKIDPEEKRKAFRHTFYTVLGTIIRI